MSCVWYQATAWNTLPYYVHEITDRQRCLGLFGHTVLMSDGADAKKIVISDALSETSTLTNWSSSQSMAFHTFDGPGLLVTFTFESCR